MFDLKPIDTEGLQDQYHEWIEFIARAHEGSNPRRNEDPALVVTDAGILLGTFGGLRMSADGCDWGSPEPALADTRNRPRRRWDLHRPSRP